MKKCITYKLMAIFFIGGCVFYTNVAQTRHLDVNRRASHEKAQKPNVVVLETNDLEAPMISRSNTREMPDLSGEKVHIPTKHESEVKMSKSDPILQLRSNNNNNASSNRIKNAKDIALNKKATNDDVEIKQMTTISKAEPKVTQNELVARVQSNHNPANGDMLEKVNDIALNEVLADEDVKIKTMLEKVGSWPNPTIVVGLPKTGTTTITAYFKCGKVPRVWHWTCGNSSEVKYCGEEILKNVQRGRPPFVGIEGANVYAQLDVLNNSPHLGNGLCYFPQVEALNAIHAAHPNSTFILPQRNVTSWIKIARKWFGDHLVRCNVTGFPDGVGSTDDELANFYTDQIRRVKEFVKKHPSHQLVEVKIDAPDAGEVLEEAFGIDRSCWGHENHNVHLAAKGSVNDAGKSKSPATLDPLLQQQQNTRRTLEHVRTIAKDLPSFITFDPERHSLTYTELEERMVPMLEKGLVLVGDSTSRILFGFLWCLMEGYYRGGEKAGDMLCQEMQEDLKRRCGGLTVKECNGIRADFTNRTSLSLQFEANFNLGTLPANTQRALNDTANIYVYFGMPCLHQLWAPGPRESVGLPSLSDWEEKFQAFFSFIGGLAKGSRPKVPMIGLSVSVCDEKMGKERELINAYLRREHLQGDGSPVFRVYNALYQNQPQKQLPLNYSGPVPVLVSYHVNRTFNHDMLNENGAVHCSHTGLLLLQKLAKKLSWNPIVLDIHGATTASCDDTSDGRHYGGLARRHQISLLLEGAMTQNVTRTTKRPVPRQQASLDSRSNRFPSVEDRVKLYMSNWYVPPCPGNFIYVNRFNASSVAIQEVTTTTQASSNTMGRTLVFKSDLQMDRIFFLDRHKLLDCTNNLPANLQIYCRDVQKTLVPVLDRVGDNGTIPVLIQFGDGRESNSQGYVNLPHIKKIRSIVTQASLSNVTVSHCQSGPRKPLHTKHDKGHLQPILWKLNRDRHYAMIPGVQGNDVAWSLKKDMAVFRGALTGVSRTEASSNTNFDVCVHSRRCRLVFHHDKSTLVDARLSTTLGLINNTLNGVELTGSSLSMKQQLQYKALIMVEGNDVATGLKWALLSNSVVMMQPPSHTSWAMEELLEPWVHYIPLDEELSDVEEKMQWVLDNDKQAQLIAQRGTLWIQDLVLHPDASNDDKKIQEEIIRRYRAHFSVSEESVAM